MRVLGISFVVATVAAVVFAVGVQVFGGEREVPTFKAAQVTTLGVSDDFARPGNFARPGRGVNVGISGIIEYVVFDGDGNILDSVIIHNTSTAALLDAASNRLATTTTTSDTSTGTDRTYDNLQLCSNDDVGAGSCSLVANISDSDGGTGINPVDTTATLGVDAGGGDTTGTYQVTDTFFCDTSGAGACSAIEELQLTGGAGTNGVSEAGVGAFQDVSVTLNDNDSIQVTWTIDLDGL